MFGEVSLKMVLALAGVIVLALSSAAPAQPPRPVNQAGYETVTLDEAGLSQMPPHPPSKTATSAACASVARRRGGEGATVTIDPEGDKAKAAACRNYRKHRSQ